MPFSPEALDELARVFAEVAFEALLQDIEQMEKPVQPCALPDTFDAALVAACRIQDPP
jgi:hypothetical protein